MSRDLVKEEISFPLDTYRKAAAHLRRPFSPGAVKWKVQSVAGKKGMIVGYLDARLVVERLNLVIPHLWTDDYERIDGKWMRCRLSVDTLTRQDVGTGNDLKAMFSDALKRAGVKFGIGVSLYAMRQTWMDMGDGKKNKLGSTHDNKPKLTPDNETWLREQYAAWLELEDRGKVFGPPLNHGDDPEGSVGEAADVQAQQLGLDEPYTDPAEAEAHEQRIRDLWESVDWKERPSNSRIPKSRLDAMLSGANGNGDLGKIEQHVREKAGVEG